MNFSSRPLVSKVPTTKAVRPWRSASGMSKVSVVSVMAFGSSGWMAVRTPRPRLASGSDQRFGSEVTGR